MKKISTPRDLLVEELKDLYSAETQLLKALPKMAKAAASEALREAFETHLDQTKVHVERLDQIGDQLGETMTGKKCKAMAGLVAESEDVIDENAEPGLHDLALIGAAQKAEHYEIAGYGTTRTLAELAGEEDIAMILQETLDEEGETDRLLTQIASETDLGTDDEEDEAEGDDQPAVKPRGLAAASPASETDDDLTPLDPVGARADNGDAKSSPGTGKKRARN